MRSRSIFLLTIGLFVLAFANPALAQDQDAAVRLAGEANGAFESGDYVTAARKFAEAHANYPDLSLKMNEMVSWYKATRCEEALVVAAEVRKSDAKLTERDKVDLGKVHTECGFEEAKAMFDAGDLDAAEARLAMVETSDAALATKIGELRGAIKERRKLVAQNQQRQDLDPPDATASDSSPAPSWTKTAGFLLIGAGVAGGITVGIKWPYERYQLRENYDPIFKNCTFSEGDCERSEVPENDLAAYDIGIRRQKVGRTSNIIIGSLGAVSLATGAAFLIYYFANPSSEGEPAQPAAQLVPVVGPDFKGAALLLQF